MVSGDGPWRANLARRGRTLHRVSKKTGHFSPCGSRLKDDLPFAVEILVRPYLSGQLAELVFVEDFYAAS